MGKPVTTPASETPDNGRVSKTRQRIRESRGAAKDVAVAAGGAGLIAALAFNRKMQRFTGRLLFGLQALGKRVLGHAGQELTDAAVLGWSLFEIQWIGLAAMNWVLYCLFPVWGWVHVTINTLWWLAFKHYEKAYMMQRVVTLLTLSGFGSIVADLNTSNRKAFWASVKKGAATAGVEMPFASWELIRKLQNAGFYFSIGCAIGAFGMLGSFGLGWAFVPAAMISGMVLWELGSSTGNNKTADGAYCVDAKEYDSLRREKDAQGKIAWIIGKGWKFTLPWFQAKSQLAAAGVLAAVVLFSWTVAFIYRSDSDRDGLSNYEERVVFDTKYDRWDSDKDGISDGEEVQRNLDPMLRLDKDPKKRAAALMYLREKAQADSAARVSWTKPSGSGDSWLSWLTHPTPAQQEVRLKIQNFTNATRWGTEDSTFRIFFRFWLLPVLFVVVVVAGLFGAKWWKSPGFMCFIMTLVGWIYMALPLWFWAPAMFLTWLVINRSRNRELAPATH